MPLFEQTKVDYISLDVVRKIHHCKFFDQLHLKMLGDLQ